MPDILTPVELAAMRVRIEQVRETAMFLVGDKAQEIESPNEFFIRKFAEAQDDIPRLLASHEALAAERDAAREDARAFDEVMELVGAINAALLSAAESYLNLDTSSATMAEIREAQDKLREEIKKARGER